YVAGGVVDGGSDLQGAAIGRFQQIIVGDPDASGIEHQHARVGGAVGVDGRIVDDHQAAETADVPCTLDGDVVGQRLTVAIETGISIAGEISHRHRAGPVQRCVAGENEVPKGAVAAN